MLDDLTAAIARRKDSQGTLPLISDRSDILEQLRGRLQALRLSDIVRDKDIQGSDLGKLTLAGGGLAALGTVIALATKLTVFDITGGILAAAGLGLVAVTLLWKRTSILREFSQRPERSRDEFRSHLDQEIAGLFDRLFLAFDHYLEEPLTRLDEQAVRVAQLADEAARLQEAADQLC